MIYPRIEYATFVDRPNRFIARVRLEGADLESEPLTVHVKNTGRCRELLVPGCRVVLARGENPNRKTPYDLVATYKAHPKHEQGWLFNMDSQAPNKVVGEWLAEQDFDLVKPEFSYGSSRVDFMMQRGSERYLLEVKGCTLEREGVGYFPDAPSDRAVKHLRELTGAVAEGWHAAVAFVVQMEGVDQVRPNTDTHPAFAEALMEAQAAGVHVLVLPCHVEPDRLWIDGTKAPFLNRAAKLSTMQYTCTVTRVARNHFDSDRPRDSRK